MTWKPMVGLLWALGSSQAQLDDFQVCVCRTDAIACAWMQKHVLWSPVLIMVRCPQIQRFCCMTVTCKGIHGFNQGFKIGNDGMRALPSAGDCTV